MIICFELSVSRDCTWNPDWFGENDVHAMLITTRKKPEMDKFQQLAGKEWTYRCKERRYTAYLSARIIDQKEAAKIRRKNKGFVGHEWMVETTLKYGHPLKFGVQYQSERLKRLMQE